MRRLLTALVSSSMFLLSLIPFVKLVEAKQVDVGSVKSTTSVVLGHADQADGGNATILSDHASHWSHSSHASHASHYSSRY